MENLKPIYLLYGEEKFLLETELKRIKKQCGDLLNGINYISLDENSIENIIQDIETPAFGYEKKLIVAKNTGLFKKVLKSGQKAKDNLLESKVAIYISENINNIIGTVTIIFIEDDISKNDLYKVIEEYGCIEEFKSLKPFEIEKRIKAICNGYKVNIDDTTVKYFISVCGTDMQTLINEIRKQIEYVGENGNITKENIDILAIKKLDSIIFDLTDNLGKKNVKVSLEILSNMIYEKEPIQKILITLYNHFKKLYFTKIAVKENKNIAQALGLKPNQMFLVQKYIMQSNYFKEEELENIMQEMRDLDYNSKTGKIDEYIGLQAIICKNCGK